MGPPMCLQPLFLLACFLGLTQYAAAVSDGGKNQQVLAAETKAKMAVAEVLKQTTLNTVVHNGWDWEEGPDNNDHDDPDNNDHDNDNDHDDGDDMDDEGDDKKEDDEDKGGMEDMGKDKGGMEDMGKDKAEDKEHPISHAVDRLMNIFEALDTDEDGNISASEWNDADASGLEKFCMDNEGCICLIPGICNSKTWKQENICTSMALCHDLLQGFKTRLGAQSIKLDDLRYCAELWLTHIYIYDDPRCTTPVQPVSDLPDVLPEEPAEPA